MDYIKSQLKFFIEKISQRPDSVPKEHYRYFVLTNYLYILAFLAHGGLLFSFALVGVNILALFNVGSCLLFIIAFFTNQRGYLALSIAIGAFEVIAHAIVCVYVLGWSSGFQYYILGLVITFFSSPLKNLNLKVFLAALMAIIYISLNYYTQNALPITTLAPILLNSFNVINLLVCIFALSFSIFASDKAAAKAERQLAEALEEVKKANLETEKKNQELASKNEQMEKKNRELANKNEELSNSYKRANLIFSALSEALPGTILEAKYRLDDKIGVGGFGAVFSATHLITKRRVAVKVFQPMSSNATAEGLERFQLEAILASRVNHHNAIEVIDSGVSGGIAFIVMELLKGSPLSEELKKKSIMSAKRAAEIILPVCDVLAKAHSAGIIHRDIKPENIFLHYCEEGEVIKVVDFGIAKLQGEIDGVRDQNLTGGGGLLGTPTYMSPERLMVNNCDAPSDIYSVGIMLYQMLAGHPPFQSSDLWKTIQMHLNDSPAPIREKNPDVSLEVEEIVMRTLRKEPNERPTARGLAEEIAKVLNIDLKKQEIKGQTQMLSSEVVDTNPTKSTTSTPIRTKPL
ncbi:MAG: protein kinase [Acidobacteria bacterium]|nr:protein kinase [Acidobacteriota bacterium]